VKKQEKAGVREFSDETSPDETGPEVILAMKS
jgi:hypothetical protein